MGFFKQKRTSDLADEIRKQSAMEEQLRLAKGQGIAEEANLNLIRIDN